MELSKIDVKHSNGNYYLWNSVDILTLRIKHHILGRYIGSMPEFPRSNTENGLPLLLSMEEVRLLYNHNIIQISECYSDKDYLESHLKEAYRMKRDSEIETLKQKYIEERKLQIQEKLDQIVDGKLRKFKTTNETPVIDRDEFYKKVLNELHSKIEDFPINQFFSVFHLESNLDSNHPVKFIQLSPFVNHLSLEALRFQVFEDFWSKGYYLSDGIKFGGDFLVYDHDPLNFHAKFIVFCLADNQQMDANFIQTYGRLGRNVRKNIILATFDVSIKEENSSSHNILYHIISWNRL